MQEDDAGNEHVCVVITIGEKGVHDHWRICSSCNADIEDIPKRCPVCGAEVIGFVDRYIRRMKITPGKGETQ